MSSFLFILLHPSSWALGSVRRISTGAIRQISYMIQIIKTVQKYRTLDIGDYNTKSVATRPRLNKLP